MSKTRKKLSLGAKILLALIGAAVIVVGAYQLYLTLKYRIYDGYKSEVAAPYVYAAEYDFKPLADDGAGLDGYVLALENDVLKFYADGASGNFALYDKRTGKYEYSNPPELESDAIANPINKEYMRSQLILTYFDTRGQSAEYNSYRMAAQLGQIEIKSVDGGARFIYTIGDTKPKAGILPIYIREARLDEILAGITNDDPAEADRVRNLLKRRWEKYDAAPGVMKLLDSIVNTPAQQKSLITQFEKLGYTHEDRMRDEEDTEVPGIESVGFVVPVEYRLDGDSLVVSVPTGNISEMGGAKIEGFKLLPFFGAANVSETGYIVVPNGSGSIIRFNNGRTNAEDYRQYVYRQDPLLAEYSTLDKTEAARLPIFGFSKGERGLLVKIENGAPLAQLFASVSGKLNEYNYANATFVLRGAMTIDMFASSGGTQTSIPVVEKPKAELEVRVRYTMLDKEHASYAGMAKYERERLIREGVLTPITDTGDIPFFMDLIGAAQGRKFFLDIAYTGAVAMTTYKQAQEIVNTLTADGITNQVVNYQGWFNKGYYHDAADKIKPVGALGSVKTLESLGAALENQGGKLYSDVLFQNVPFSSERFGGYNWVYETSRYYGGGMVAAFGLVDPLTYYNTASLGYTELVYDQLSPKFLGRYVDGFLGSFKKYKISGVSLRDLGDSLASDRKRTEVISRSEAEEIVKTNFEKFSGYSLLVQGGNYYSLAYADAVIGAPLSHNPFYIVDEEIPFYEIVLSGCIDYAGGAVNLSSVYDERLAALKLIELGASPRFTFTSADASEMKYTALNPKYSTTFSNWESAAANVYKTVNAALRQTRGKGIVGHETVQSGVKKITYDGGTVIYVNYNDYAVDLGTVKVGARDYFADEGGAR